MDATRVAVVTGAASGLGLAWPAELAQRARTDALREGQLPEVAALVAKEVR
jgi:NAD(P)-dependent dehydrogenase (short-subunit alcohol dehydrogenase family)